MIRNGRTSQSLPHAQVRICGKALTNCPASLLRSIFTTHWTQLSALDRIASQKTHVHSSMRFELLSTALLGLLVSAISAAPKQPKVAEELEAGATEIQDTVFSAPLGEIRAQDTRPEARQGYGDDNRKHKGCRCKWRTGFGQCYIWDCPS